MKSVRYVLVGLLLFNLSSCDPILDCIVNAHPELEERALAIGSLGLRYREEIFAEVRNDPQDDQYVYYFNYNLNDLPRGLDIIEYDRSVVIIGVPEERGTFDFQLGVVVDYIESGFHDEQEGPFYDEDFLCDTDDFRSYELIIR